ncbi:hypothetical protein SKAU_G00339150 [Synaphobranchus kaupii]|uniref:Uncharacterized protein n=1 Tax=Synaphobranchus kaupii TaxID=118154 RepID=A0A9Q1IJC8_SYNKA|nr:hypothetical protein SKAU_G00339150 [Synaphobranchus kaupii]
MLCNDRWICAAPIVAQGREEGGLTFPCASGSQARADSDRAERRLGGRRHPSARLGNDTAFSQCPLRAGQRSADPNPKLQGALCPDDTASKTRREFGNGGGECGGGGGACMWAGTMGLTGWRETPVCVPSAASARPPRGAMGAHNSGGFCEARGSAECAPAAQAQRILRIPTAVRLQSVDFGPGPVALRGDGLMRGLHASCDSGSRLCGRDTGHSTQDVHRQLYTKERYLRPSTDHSL